jgi:NAD(P)-dependent dehydrogenase (short-subunit alcohol dehydrogenase family)
MQEKPLAGKIAIVTGAGHPLGLGYAMTLALVGAGARVAMMDVNPEALEQGAVGAREVGGRDAVLPILGDVGNPDDAERAVQQTIAELGGLHILLNNAGINPRFAAEPGLPTFAQIPPEVWARAFSVNVFGPFHMARAVAPHLLKQGWGRIIGVTTSLDTMLRGMPYGPTKASHEAFIAAIARELEGSGVTANVLIPGGAVATNMTDPGRTDLLKPAVMQAPAVWLASEASAGLNGHRLVAEFWDESLPLEERLARASAPAAWPQLGRRVSRG